MTRDGSRTAVTIKPAAGTEATAAHAAIDRQALGADERSQGCSSCEGARVESDSDAGPESTRSEPVIAPCCIPTIVPFDKSSAADGAHRLPPPSSESWSSRRLEAAAVRRRRKGIS